MEIFKEVKKNILKIITSKSIDKKEVDEEISLAVQDLFKSSTKYSHFKFYSEEHPAANLGTPLLLLDPIDGTYNFRKNNPECCISLSLLNSFKLDDPQNTHWIWNFNNDDEILFYENKFKIVNSNYIKPQLMSKTKFNYLISRKDYEKYSQQLSKVENIHWIPVGSIAYKLGLLAIGEADGVFSISPKHTWDICAGTMILALQNFHTVSLLSSKKLLLNQKLVKGPMVWTTDLESTMRLKETYLNQLNFSKKHSQ